MLRTFEEKLQKKTPLTRYCPKDNTHKAQPKRHHSQNTAQKTPLTRHCP